MWNYKNFFGENYDDLMEELTNFLNEEGIKNFKITERGENYIEIIYFEK